MKFKDILKEKKLNEGIFSKLIDLIFFKDINDKIDKAVAAVDKTDPELIDQADKNLQDMKKNADEIYEKLEVYCAQPENKDKYLCKKYLAGELFQMKWKDK